MSSSNNTEPLAASVACTRHTLSVQLVDGRTISVPIGWYPRLAHATPAQRASWRLIGKGRGIHWPELDEDVSVRNLLDGEPSGESQASFKKWLEARGRRKSTTP